MTRVTVTRQDGTRRTLATANPADLVTVGVMAKAGEPPEALEQRFTGQLVEEPQGLPDLLRVAVQRSAN